MQDMTKLKGPPITHFNGGFSSPKGPFRLAPQVAIVRRAYFRPLLSKIKIWHFRIHASRLPDSEIFS